jgi:hypothetical protein
MPGVLLPKDKLALQTRQKRDIENLLDRGSPDAGRVLETQKYIAKYSHCTHRTKAPCLKYNCHGLTFAARRTAIDNPTDVQAILDDDGYQKIPTQDVLPGDIAIYRAPATAGAEIEHSGVVVSPPGGLVAQPLILSKWGAANEVIHRAYDSPYVGSIVEYYRVTP